MVISVAELEAIELWEKLPFYYGHIVPLLNRYICSVRTGALMITAHPAGYYNYVATVKG